MEDVEGVEEELPPLERLRLIATQSQSQAKSPPSSPAVGRQPSNITVTGSINDQEAAAG